MAKDKKDDTPNQQAEDQQPQGEPPQDSKPRVLAAGDPVELHCADGIWRRATVTRAHGVDLIDLRIDLRGEALVITSVPRDPTGKSGDCYREIKGD